MLVLREKVAVVCPGAKVSWVGDATTPAGTTGVTVRPVVGGSDRTTWIGEGVSVEVCTLDSMTDTVLVVVTGTSRILLTTKKDTASSPLSNHCTHDVERVVVGVTNA